MATLKQHHPRYDYLTDSILPDPAVRAAHEVRSLTHPEMVAALAKPGADILSTLTPEKVNTWHMSTGVVGEAGELSEAIKKHVAYGKALDRENVIEELGDLEFYLEGIRQSLGITREETLAHNIAKLSARYAKLTYSDTAAIARADKA